MERGELVYACALGKIFNYNCHLANILLDYYIHPSRIFSAALSELQEVVNGKHKALEEIFKVEHLENAEKEIEWANNYGINILYIGDRSYPYRLKMCDDAPIVLYYKGTSDLNQERIISMVGTRLATEYGKSSCRKIVEALSSLETPPLIVSGLAFGIDITAHIAALDYGLETLGVMATGLDEIYPSAHRNIAAKMIKQGGVISDFCSKSSSIPLHFVKRNRIIAGISDAVILLESKSKGGGVITANMASAYSREVFALMGRLSDKYSAGCNSLIQQQIAIPFSDFNYIGKYLNWGNARKKNSIFREENEIKRKILLALSKNSMDIDSLTKLTSLSSGEISLYITELEMENKIKLFHNKFSII